MYLIIFSCLQSKLQSATKLKKILQDSKETVVESDVKSRMQPLKEQLTNTVNHLHTIFETHVFIAICRGYWDRMGQVRCLPLSPIRVNKFLEFRTFPYLI